MVNSPTQCPVLTAALVAACGVGLIVVSSVWPAGNQSGVETGKRVASEHLYERHLRALSELRRAGLTGSVDVVDFGDGLGLGVSQSVPAGAVLLRVPEALALDTDKTRNCLQEETSSGWLTKDDSPADCKIERMVVRAVSRGEASKITGLVALLVMERRRGLLDSLGTPAAGTAALAVLPEPSWQAESGIFAIDEEEFRVFGAGTSMEGWQQASVNDTAGALEFVQKTFASATGSDAGIGLDEIRWAYLALHSRGQWVNDDHVDEGLAYPSNALFLYPLLLARPTPEWQHGVQLQYDRGRQVYEVVAQRAMRYGEEIHFVDRRLSDASALCFRGLQLVGQHRARITLDVSSQSRDPLSQPTLDKHGCGAQPLRLYLQAQKTVDSQFLACMRMLALSGNFSRLSRALNANWTKSWPDSVPVDQKSELGATTLAVTVLQHALTKFSSSNAEIRQRFGSDAVTARPTVRVREAESMIVVGLLKSMKELQLVGSNEYLFDALREAQRKEKREAKARKDARDRVGMSS